MSVFLPILILGFLSNGICSKGSSEIDMMLKDLNKPAIKSIHSEDGDIIDCIDIYKQPAFDHPALRNHKIQAAYLISYANNYTGSKADINVWNPRVEPGDYSSGQIWMFAGPGDSFESIEAGWVVNPGVFRDSRTRMFVHWTRDAYKTTGCFNLLCSGFVQTNPKIALGGAIEPISSPGGQQYQITIGLQMDPSNSNWWLHLGDAVVGYWPGSLFSWLNQGAIIAQWGGEVYSPNVRKAPHTKTGMGSGDWAYNLWQKACFATNLRIIDSSLQLKFPENIAKYSDESHCYATQFDRETSKNEPLFYFGGPGQNPQCP